MTHGINTHTSAEDVLFMRAGSIQVREVAVGVDTLTVGNSGTISVDSDSAIVTGNTVMFATPGRFTVTYAGGSFPALAYEAAALDRVPLTQSSGAIGKIRSDYERRMVLRSLATHSDWDGTAEDVSRHNLLRYGA